MKKYLSVFAVLLLFPLSSAQALSWEGPSPFSNSFDHLFAPGGSYNPIQVEIKSLPSYCQHLPSFAAAWMQYTSCAPVLAQKNLQSTLQQMNENLHQQNKLAQQAQKWSLFNMLRPIPIAPVVVQVPATQSAPMVARSNDQWCKDDYGSHSIWNGTLNSGGGPECGCKAGYDFNATNVRCVPVEKVNFGCDESGCWAAGASSRD